MARILGLDLGTNSIGWAVVDDTKKEIIKSTMPYLPVMFKNKDMRNNIVKELDLDEEEVEWLKTRQDTSV